MRVRIPALLLLVGLAACAGPIEGGQIHLVVLHTNDVHGQVLPRPATWIDREDPPLVGGLPRVGAEVQRVRSEEQDAIVLLVDAGDWFQGTPEGGLDGGVPFVFALTRLGYDAASLGNHEFDLGTDHLRALLEETRPPAVAANLLDPATGERVEWVEPWVVVERDGLRVALVGLITTETPEITHADARRLDFADPVEALARARAELGQRADLVIPVGHVSAHTGERIARAHPDLPLIVTGHSHTYLRGGVRVGDALVVQAGDKATVLGRVDLWLDRETLAVLHSESRLIDLLEEPPPEHRNAVLEAACSALAERAGAAMGEVVGELSAPLTRSRGLFTSVPTAWVADVIRARTGADVGIHNRGGTRSDLAAGPVTRRELFELLPFGNDVVTVTLTGAELEAVVRGSVEGTAYSGLDYGGLVAFVREGGGGVELVRVEVGGEPLELERDYRVSTNSFLASGGDRLPAFTAGRDRTTDPILLRELAEQAFRCAGTVDPPGDERIVLVQE